MLDNLRNQATFQPDEEEPAERPTGTTKAAMSPAVLLTR